MRTANEISETPAGMPALAAADRVRSPIATYHPASTFHEDPQHERHLYALGLYLYFVESSAESAYAKTVDQDTLKC